MPSVIVDLDLLLLCSMVGSPRRSVPQLTAALSSAGIPKITEAKVSLALRDLKARLDSSIEYPFTVMEEGGNWSMLGKTPLCDRLLNGGRIQFDEPLTQRDLEVLSVIIFCGTGVSAHRIRSYFRTDPSTSIDTLLRLRMVSAIPHKGHTHYIPAPGMLSRFGFSSVEEIPGYSEYRSFIDGQKDADAAIKAANATPAIKKLRRASKR